MRPEFDSEIDSVLRGHARRGGAASAAWDALARPSISDESRSGSHLDADEIAAFGEDALPAAARSLYSAHLADCDDCRRSVTQVAFAAGVADRINERERADAAVAGSGRVAEGERAVAHATPSPSAAAQSPSVAAQSPTWRERLSSLFAPRAWRYAMPVVALFALGAVVFVAMRGTLREGAFDMESRGGSAGRQRASAPAASAAPEMHHAGAKPQPQPGTTAETQPAETGTAGIAPANEESQEKAVGGELAKLGAKSTDSVDPSAPVSTVGPTVAQKEVAQLPSAQPAPPPATANFAITPQPSPVPSAPAAATTAPRAMISRDGVPLAMPTPSPVEPEMTERGRGEARAVPRDEAPATKRHGPQRNAAGRSAELGSASGAVKDGRAMSRPARGPQKNNEANRNYPDEAKAKREEDRDEQARQQQRAETRSVGGRNFRREGGVWIDTAYRSGQVTVSMRRDSEQYRALVADEPEIGRISRSLGGEAVIVWKGRAYRVKP